MPGAQTSARTGEPGFRAARAGAFRRVSWQEHERTGWWSGRRAQPSAADAGLAAATTELKQEVEPERVYSRSTRPTIDRQDERSRSEVP